MRNLAHALDVTAILLKCWTGHRHAPCLAEERAHLVADGLKLTCNIHFAHALTIMYMQQKISRVFNLPNTEHF